MSGSEHARRQRASREMEIDAIQSVLAQGLSLVSVLTQKEVRCSYKPGVLC